MNASEYHNLARLESLHWWYVGMNAIAADWLRCLPWRDGGLSRLLDAGCGAGGWLKQLTAFGQSCGVDLHPFALRLAAAGGCRSLVRANIEALPFTANQFAVVTSLDVLYHLNVTHDEQALREFARVLRPGGWLLLRLPAYDWLRGAHDVVVHTRHRYTCREVRAKLQTAGLRPVRVTYANTILFPLIVLWRCFFRGHAASDVRLPSAPLNRILIGLLGAERFWLRRFNLPVGLSVLALAQKEACP